MNKRTIIAILLAFTISVGVTALWSAEGDEREGDTATNIVAVNESPSGEVEAETPKKKGNRFARLFKAPFKAVGRVFGGGGDRDGRMGRLSEKDVAKFESVGVVRVDDARNEEERLWEGDDTARGHLGRGRAHLEGGRYNEAIAELSRATSLDPRLAQAHSLLAVAFERRGLHDRAKDSYERSIKINDDDPQALNNIGYSLYINGNYRAAIERLKRAAKLAPGDERILNNLALAQSRLGKYDDAFKSFARAGGELNGRMNTAALLERAGRDEEALKHYEAARRLEPSSATLLRRLAEVYERTGRHGQAEAARHDLNVFSSSETAKN
ncbi:MAG TPA: tetratricopeptide repeat protein [Pyrinomonadaceae bacterium]|nr:tetratricopeptide repeat protein [Pyrinomonadaceae bacterium]